MSPLLASYRTRTVRELHFLAEALDPAKPSFFHYLLMTALCHAMALGVADSCNDDA